MALPRQHSADKRFLFKITALSLISIKAHPRFQAKIVGACTGLGPHTQYVEIIETETNSLLAFAMNQIYLAGSQRSENESLPELDDQQY